MATPSVPQKSVSRRYFLSGVAALPIAAALAPIMPLSVEASAPNVDGWHVYQSHWVLDGAGEDLLAEARAVGQAVGMTRGVLIIITPLFRGSKCLTSFAVEEREATWRK